MVICHNQEDNGLDGKGGGGNAERALKKRFCRHSIFS